MSFRRTILRDVDAFGRARVSQPVTLFDSKQLAAEHTMFWDEKTVGYASVEFAPPARRLSVLVDGDQAIMQTRMRFNYQPGKSQQVMMTGLLAPDAGVAKRIGQFDGQNGIFFQVDGSGPSWGIMRGGAVVESAAQDEWNLSGGLPLDLSAVQIITFDYEWLGVGTVRVGFVIGGATIYVHAFHHANVAGNTSAYMNTPNLPLRFDVTSTGGAGSGDHICATVISEGGQQQYGMLHSVDMGITPITIANAGELAVLLAVRLKADHLDSIVIPAFASLLATTANDNLRWALLLNPTIDEAYPSSPLDWVGNHLFEYAAGAGQLVTDPGLQMQSGYVSSQVRESSFDPPNAVYPGASIDGVPDVLVLAASSLTDNVNIVGALTLRELL